MNFIEALTVLESQNCRVQDKEDAYRHILKEFEGESTRLEDDSLSAHSQRLLRLLSQDVVLCTDNVPGLCLQILQLCLRASYFRSSQSSDSSRLLEALIQCAQKTLSMDVLKKSLVCLATQNFAASVVTSQASTLVDMIEAVNAKAKSQSCSVLEETVNLFVRLEEQISTALRPLVKRWARFVLPGLASSSDVVREKSYTLLVKFNEDMCQAPDLSKHLVKAISSGLAQSLKALMNKNALQALKTWALVVDICGKEFHRGSSINLMLEVIEIGFKSSPEAKCQAFVAWRSLISNFGLDTNVISDPKRIKLLMMVFRFDNARAEPVAVEKMLTWWHFVINVGQKLSANIEKILYPMFQFCVGKTNQAPRSGLKPAGNLQNSVLSLQGRGAEELPSFPTVQKLGLQAVALLLSKSATPKMQGISCNLEHLSFEVFAGSATFAKHAGFLLNVIHNIFRELNKEIEESLVIYTWTALAGYIKTALDSPAKAMVRDMFSSFLTDFQSMAEQKIFTGETLFKMTEVCNTFPPKILASTAFNVSGTMRGCPALLLSEVLLSPVLMEASSSSDRYLKLFSFLTEAGASNVQGALGFLQTISQLLDTNSSSLDSAELLCKMWNLIAKTLQDTIVASNEVNQGDALECNFGCMNAVLILPVKQQLASRVSQTALKAMLRSWKELYHSFARLSALVTTAEANTCLEETCSNILQKINMESAEPSELEFLASLATKMLDCIDFSTLPASHGSGAFLTLSPRKWARRRQKPMGNLHSFVHFLAAMQKDLNSVIFSEEKQEKQESQGGAGKGKIFEHKNEMDLMRKTCKIHQTNPAALITTANTLVEVFNGFFIHINTPALILNGMCELAEPIAGLYQHSSQCSVQRLFTGNFYTKLEKLWHDISLCIGGRYSEPYNSELLAAVSPLFEATFPHSKRTIKNQALALWNTTFSRALRLEYPSALKPVLARVKEKLPIVLPGWIAPEDIPVIAESPFSEMSMGMDSQVVPPPVLPSMPSPKRPRASMLNKDLSPARNKHVSPPATAAKASPSKVMTPKQARKLFASTTPHQNMVDLLPKEVFVVITSPTTKKKRLLTEHQKEVLKEKRTLPAMYNNLDASQDVSLMSQFGTETQNECTATQDMMVSLNNNQDSGDKKQILQPAKSADESQPQKNSIRRSERLSSKDVGSESQQGRLNEVEEQLPSSDAERASAVRSSDSLIHKTEDCIGSEKASKTSNKPETGASNKGAAQENSPFIIFRQTAPNSPPLSLSQDTESSRSKTFPRRVSLRKIQSEDSLSSGIKKENFMPQGEKSPRRVPLKKLDSPKNEDGSKLGMNVLSSWSARLAQSSSNKVAQKARDSYAAMKDTCSLLLVEDTQSPEKLKKERVIPASHSITETPTKSDDSISPHLRSSSARKLFLDEEPKPKENVGSEASTPLSSKQEAPASNAADSTVPAADPDEAISSSQGFETGAQMDKEKIKAMDHHTMFGFSQLLNAEAEAPPPATEAGTSQEPIVITNDKESQSVAASSQESDSFFHLMMPTMASPSTHPQSSLLSSKSSPTSGKTQSTSSDPVSSKSSSSPEADFFPAQSTFAESSLKDVVNKRKRITPKKYSPEKIKRRSRHGVTAQATISNKEKEGGKQNLEKHTAHLTVEKTRAEEGSDNVSSPQQSTHCPHKSLENLQKIPSGSPELGEITPDMKSPPSATPQRGHSSTKRKRKMSQEIGGEPKARKSISPEADKDSDISQQVVRKGGSQLYKEGQRNKRKLSGFFLTKSPKSRHMLRTRSKSSSGSPPPRKLRKLGADKVRKTGEDGEKISTSASGEEASEQEVAEIESEDDMPLASLKKSSTVIVEVPTVRHGSPLPKDTSQPKSITSNILQDSAAVIVSENAPKIVNNNCTSSPILESENNESFKIVDEVLSTALSVMVKEISSQKTGPGDQQLQPDECTPLLLSEDMNKEAEESPDHLQAGQVGVVLTNEADGPEEDPQILSVELPDKQGQQDLVCIEPLESGKSSVCTSDSEAGVSSKGKDDVGLLMQGDHLSKISKDAEVARSPTSTKAPDNDKERAENSLAMEVDERSVAERVDSETAKQLPADTELTEPAAGQAHDDKNEIEAVSVPTMPEPRVVLHDWSPSKSPSFSILKKSTGTPSPGGNRVSFAEPVVNGESPIREKYHSESLPTSPLISKSCKQRKSTPFTRSLGKLSGYKRRINQAGKQTRLLQGSPASLPSSPMKSQSQSPSQHKATQESQLDSVNPIFPDLVDCARPVDGILPQLTTSLWYRGLHHMMKGRSINTIGDLSALTEVQVNQLPIRNPKVDTARVALRNYSTQQGLLKPSVKPAAENLCSTPSKGATMEQAVTPSSIADEGIEVRPHDDDLDRLSPIEDIEAESHLHPTRTVESPQLEKAAPSTSSSKDPPTSAACPVSKAEKPGNNAQASILLNLSSLVENISGSNSSSALKTLNTTELFDVHQKLNSLFGAVVEEMKARHSQDS